MLQRRTVEVTVLLSETYKSGKNHDKVWMNLLAVDFSIWEECSWGAFIGEWETVRDISILEGVEGVEAVHVHPPEEVKSLPIVRLHGRKKQDKGRFPRLA